MAVRLTNFTPQTPSNGDEGKSIKSDKGFTVSKGRVWEKIKSAKISTAKALGLSKQRFENTLSQLTHKSMADRKVSKGEVETMKTVGYKAPSVENLMKGGLSSGKAKEIAKSLENYSLTMKDNESYRKLEGSPTIHFIRNPKTGNVESYFEIGKVLGKGGSKEVLMVFRGSDGEKMALGITTMNEDEDVEEQKLKRAGSEQELNIYNEHRDSDLFTKVETLVSVSSDGVKFDIHAMELASKGSLKGLLSSNEGKTLSFDQRLKFFQDGAKAILESHKLEPHKNEKILHDIKEENFLVMGDTLKAADYGLFTDAKGMKREEYESGTPQYFPPECGEIENPTAEDGRKKDWFAFGLVSWNLLKGEQCPAVSLTREAKKEWLNKLQEPPLNTPEHLVYRMLKAESGSRVDDKEVEVFLNKMNEAKLIFENSNATKFNMTDGLKYVENLPLALQMGLVTKEQARETLINIAQMAKRETNEKLVDEYYNKFENIERYLILNNVLSKNDLKEIF